MKNNIWTDFYEEEPVKIKELHQDKEFVEEIVERSSRHVKDGSFLDVGAGNNSYSNYFKGIEYTGLDIYNFKRENFICSDINKRLPFKDNKFQTVFGILILEYIKNKEKVLKEIHRVLRKDGYLIIVAPNSKSIPIILSYKIIPFFAPKIDVPYYPFDIKKFIKMAEEYNFKLVEKSYIPFTYLILPKIFRKLFRIIGNLWNEEVFLVFNT